jgi:hypothetical protein
MIYAVQITLCVTVYIPSSVKTTDVQAVLRFCPRNLRCSNVGITDGGLINYAVDIG